jgi:multidrug transporter EmrE-like cation transporter
MKGMALGIGVLCVLLSAAAQLLMKRGMTPDPALLHSAASGPLATYQHALGSPLVWLGFTLYGASAVLWLWVLSRLDVSLAYPLVSLGFVVTFALGIVWLGEPFTWLKAAGCTLIVVGVGLLALDA